MSTRARSGVALLALLGALFAGFVTVPAAADAGAEAEFVRRINDARAARGLGGLQVDGELTTVARRWAQRMADEKRLSHNPNLAKEVTQDWEKLAENVGFGGDAASIHEAFMNSAAHRANILDGALTHVGVGVVVDGAGQLWVTEVFMRLRGGASAGGGAAPPTTAAPPPPPPTTARPRPVPTTAPVAPVAAAPTATPTTAAPAPAPEPEASAPPAAAPEPVGEPAAARAAAPNPRLVLVLARLAALDEGR